VEKSPLSALPLHPTPALPDLDDWLLVLSDGETEIALNRADIRALAHTDVIDRFTCLEGWTTAPLGWRGVRLEELFRRLPTLARGPYLAVSAPDTCSVISTSDLPIESILADTLDGNALPIAHGGPYRMIVPGGVCFESVKWVPRIERCDTASRAGARSRLAPTPPTAKQ
jgi:DMSO/TMAO reductase YedYZ molybdopterin-dependent catalytic subunit